MSIRRCKRLHIERIVMQRAVLVIGAAVLAACTPPPRPPSIQVASSTPREPIGQPSATSTDIPMTDTVTPAPSRGSLLDPDEYGLAIHWAWSEEPGGTDGILTQEGADQGFTNWLDPPIYRMLTWDGNLSDLFSLTYNESLTLETPAILDIPPAENHMVAFGLSDSIHLQQLYWVDLQQMSFQGYDPGCESMTTAGDDAIAINAKWLAYHCDEDKYIWNLVSVKDPSFAFSISAELPLGRQRVSRLMPHWRDADTLILDNKGGSTTRCVINVADPNVPVINCRASELYLGPYSPDGGLIEVREPYRTMEEHPIRMGVLRADCFEHSDQCQASLYPAPFALPPGDDYIEAASWVPDGSAILYLVKHFDRGDNDSIYDTEVWLFDIARHTYEEIATFEPDLYMQPNYFRGSAIWSADGNMLALQNASGIFAFNLATRELKTLTNEKMIAVGSITLP